MRDTEYRIYGYRWVVLGAFMLVNFIIQVLWISYAPITADAARFFGVSELKIGFLAMVFMIVYVPLSIPASWAIDRYGFKKAAGLASIMMVVFGALRGFAGTSYALALTGSLGLAVAQPLFLNAWTKLPAHWFPRGERATAVGLITLSNLLGIAGGMVATPMLAPIVGIPGTQYIFSGFAALSTLAFLLAARESPPSPPGPVEADERALMFDGVKHALRVPSFRLFLGVVFVGMGIFNGVTTWIEEIVRPRGFGPQEAGTFGALLLVGGILGAVAIPALSDRSGKRRPYMMLGIIATIPGLLGMTWFASFWPIAASAFVLGFFLTSVMPVGMQFSTEITVPTPEGTSNGLIQLFGQASVVFVFIMDALRSRSGSLGPGMLLSCALLVVAAFLILRMSETGKAEEEAPRPTRAEPAADEG
ncbi:MAG TPA: MFS transporter [Rectinemataceae bacterium]|nr:MFS transporter [Rectinemataceae bacterium]